MPSLFELAVARVPSALRDDARRVAVTLAMGYTSAETARRLEMRPARVEEFRSMLQGGVVKALEADGYSVGESVRYLGVPTAAIYAVEAHGAP